MDCRTSVPEPANSPYGAFPDDAFSRLDESDDRAFYARDRFVNHLDSLALATVEAIIGQLVVEDRPAVLDLMASWDSHLPPTIEPSAVVGLGLNQNELAGNPRLTEIVIHDLNRDPRLPFSGESFDVVVNTVSVDYLVRPFEVFREAGRVLKPGGLFLVVFSTRMFAEKATKIWRESTETERVRLVERFFDLARVFEPPKVFVSSGRPRPEDDKYAHLGIPSDPVYAVYAEKRGGASGKTPRPEISPPGEKSRSEGESGRRAAAPGRPFCPHCGQGLKKWRVPNHPFCDWDTDFLYICFNDSCPYLVEGWRTMCLQGNQGMSYRFVYDPVRGSSIPVPVVSLHALKDGIVE